MARSRSTVADLQGFLAAQSPLWLAGRLLAAARRDPTLLAELEVAASGGSGVDVVRRELGRALWVADYVDEEDAPTYVAEADRALGMLDKLISDGPTDGVVELAEHAMDLLADAVGKVQDEGDAHTSLCWAQEIHLRAVTAARPDRVGLAERLFARAVADEWGVFTNVVDDYGKPLGAAGRRRLRELIGQEVGRLPRLGPGQSGDGRRHTVLQLAERAARADGVDAVVDVLAYSLTSARAFVRICEELVTAGCPEQALEWAERGLRECGGGRVDHGLGELRRLAIGLYATLGRDRDAVELAWRDFEAAPSLEGYQSLHQHGQAEQSWPGWRDKAMMVLHAQPRLGKGQSPVGPYHPPGHSTLVHVLLCEGDVDATWRAARHGGCAEGLWLSLARRRAEQHPGDAVPVLRRHVDTAIATAKRDGYECAAGLLAELGTYYDRLGASADFAEYVQALRKANSRRRNLLAAFDVAGLPR